MVVSSKGPTITAPSDPLLSCLIERYSQESICILDYGNYPYLRSTSAVLREMGMNVRYLFSSSFQSPHHSSSSQNHNGTPNEIGIAINGKFKKYSFIRRWNQERQWARNCIAYLEKAPPTVLFSSNTPLEVQAQIASWCKRKNIPFIFWLQDVQGIAIGKLLGRKWPLLGHAIGLYYQRLEKRLLRASDHVILISDDHLALARRYGIQPDRVSVLPNWALVDEFPILPRENHWALSHNLAGTFNFVYSG